ncbi:MAG: hypothetical protein PHH54_05895 [Candidatus Nanoarchaeia archaeon]|nr:hypothetical protein [Candidatus Nanoarchaeia archaeon]MDD5741487.1 hypothetical protein [Candidatus Nanoarchaeia archaeon]
MAKSKPVGNLINIAAWITGVLVSLAVGFGMVDGVLTVRFIPDVITVIAGWLVVVLTVISVVLAIANKL